MTDRVKKQMASLKTLLTQVVTSDSSRFYADIWDGAFSVDALETSEDMEQIPPLTLSQLYSVPLPQRLYKEDRLLTKITTPDPERQLFIARRADDIAYEGYGTAGVRPLVYFDSNHEALEKSLWYYEQNILPLINEVDPRVTANVAATYAIDAITTDTEGLRTILPELAQHYDTEALKHISIVDTQFSLSALRKLLPQSIHRLVLALPEAGTIAVACPEYSEKGEIVFHPHDSSLVEIIDGKIVLTRLVMLPTPIIRYRTELHAEWASCSCRCGLHGFVQTHIT